MANFFRSNLETGIEIESIAVTTQPTTTSYMQGDTFDPTGMVVTASASGMTGDVTSRCTFSPMVLETAGTQTVTVSYLGLTTTFTVSVSEVSISITTPPTKTEYEKGDTLDLSGIVVTAMDGQRTKNITSECTFSPANGNILTTAGNVAITATYYGHTASTNILVAGFVGISVTTPPDTTMYPENGTLDLTGIVVTADYVAYTKDVTTQCIFAPANGATLTSLDTTLTATYMEATATTPLNIVSSALNSNSWATIKEIGSQGLGDQYWSIGDSKSVYVSGSFGTVSLSGTYNVFIVHFNYKSQNGVYFQCFRTTDGIDITLVGSLYGTGNTAAKTDGTKACNMNHWGSGNYGGWAGCDARYDVLGSTDVAPSGYGAQVALGRVGYDPTSTCATSPKSGTLMAALPSDLRAVMSPFTVYQTDGGKTAAIQSSVDYLPLLSTYEIMSSDAASFANSAEKSYVEKLSYYSNSSNQKYKHKATKESAYYWLRSGDKSLTTAFLVQQGGTTDRTGHCESKVCVSFCPWFRVA